MKIDLIIGSFLLVVGSANGLAESHAPGKFDPDVKNWQAVPVPLESDESAYNKFYGIFTTGDWHDDSVKWTVELKKGRTHASVTSNPHLRSSTKGPGCRYPFNALTMVGWRRPIEESSARMFSGFQTMGKQSGICRLTMCGSLSRSMVVILQSKGSNMERRVKDL